jgi:hypothetical protein
VLNPALPPPHVIARRIPRCPNCNGRDYCYVTENTEDGFLLRNFSCEGCGADILDVYRRTTGSEAGSNPGSAQQFFLVVLGALVIFMILLDGLI